jgi:pimeloyl-ACP methyl ester carboxylesterase
MADPLVLIPGPLMDMRIFLPQVIALSEVAPVVVPGFRPQATVEAMADEILPALPASFALMGHGLGGAIALELLRRLPNRISRIVLVATDPLPPPRNQSAERDDLVVKARAGRHAEALSRCPAIRDYASRPETADLAAVLTDMALTRGVEAFALAARAEARRPDQQRLLRTARQPVLIVAGAEDPMVPARRAGFMAELLVRAETCLIEGAGHLPTLEAPDEVNARLRAFLAAPLVLSRKVS